jgi:hypothetical protein
MRVSMEKDPGTTGVVMTVGDGRKCWTENCPKLE